MKKAQFLVSVLLLVLLLSACAPKAAPAPVPQAPAAPAPAAAAPAPAIAPTLAKPAWQIEWERVLAEAKKEGRVVLATSAGAEPRAALVQGLSKAYGINVEAVSGRPAEITVKIVAERRVGLYLWDVYVGGVTTPVTAWKPIGVLDPLDPVLILPEVTDPDLIKKVWNRGRLWWVDNDHTVLASLQFPQPPLAVNTKLVKPEEIKSYNDLLDTKWKGKASLNDPTMGGSTFPSFMIHLYGADWLRKLAQNEPIIMRNERLQVEWLAQGKVPIALGLKADTYTEFKNAGAPVEAITPKEGTWLSTGGSVASIYNRPAHPNAAKVFINWLLSKEGQTILAKAFGGQSTREDVPTDFLPADRIRQAGVEYWEKDREEVTLQRPAEFKLNTEIFGPLLK